MWVVPQETRPSKSPAPGSEHRDRPELDDTFEGMDAKSYDPEAGIGCQMALLSQAASARQRTPHAAE